MSFLTKYSPNTPPVTWCKSEETISFTFEPSSSSLPPCFLTLLSSLGNKQDFYYERLDKMFWTVSDNDLTMRLLSMRLYLGRKSKAKGIHYYYFYPEEGVGGRVFNLYLSLLELV